MAGWGVTGVGDSLPKLIYVAETLQFLYARVQLTGGHFGQVDLVPDPDTWKFGLPVELLYGLVQSKNLPITLLNGASLAGQTLYPTAKESESQTPERML